MKKILLGLIVISLFVISGCNYQIIDNIGGPSSLKGYLESDLPNMNPEDIFPPNARLVRAVVIETPINCNDVELPEGAFNDCGIFNGYNVILKDTKEDYTATFSLILENFPYSGLDLIEEGYTCNFLFEGYKVKEVMVCEDETGTIIYEKKFEPNNQTLSPVFYSGSISEEEAVKIAMENGLEGGINGYKTELRLYKDIWTWQVSNTLDKGGSGGTYYENGKSLIIHAYTGEVVEELTWDLTA